jgi:hypothetical protein
MQFENLPDDIILEFLSHMNSRQIVNTCKANRNVNRLCKSNRNLITKYSLKNDYGFTIFPQNYDYISIRSYMVETFGMSAYKFNNRNRMLMDVVKDNRIDVLRFLVANGANIFEDAVTTAVKYKKIDALKYFIEEKGGLQVYFVEVLKDSAVGNIYSIKSHNYFYMFPANQKLTLQK